MEVDLPHFSWHPQKQPSGKMCVALGLKICAAQEVDTTNFVDLSPSFLSEKRCNSPTSTSCIFSFQPLGKLCVKSVGLHGRSSSACKSSDWTAEFDATDMVKGVVLHGNWYEQQYWSPEY